MIVERTTDLNDIFQTLPYEEYVSSKKRDMSKLRDRLLFVQSQIDNPNFGFFVVRDEGTVRAYALLMLVTVPGAESAQLLRMYAKNSNYRDALIDEMMNWCKDKKIKIGKLTVPWKGNNNNRYARAMNRKFGFVPDSINLVRRI